MFVLKCEGTSGFRITYNNAGIRSKKKNGNNPVVREKTINLNRNGCHLKGKVNRTRK